MTSGPFINKIGFCIGLDFITWEPQDILKCLSTNGYKAVEWTEAHFNPRTKSRKELRYLIKLSEDFGLHVSEIKAPQDLVCLDEQKRRDRIKFIKETIIAAADSGVNTINVFTGPAFWDRDAPVVGRDISEGEAWEYVLDAYEEFVPLAEKYKVYLAVEGCAGMITHDFYTTKYLIERFDSEYLGVNLDPSHGILYGNYDVGWVVKQWGRKIKNIHLKDAVGRFGEMNKDFIFPLLGEGVVDWKAFLKALDEIKYKGFLSIEFESFKYYRDVLNSDSVKAVKISMEQIKRLTKL